MLVKDLIEALQKLPPEKEVVVENFGSYSAVSVWLYENSTYPLEESYVVISPTLSKD